MLRKGWEKFRSNKAISTENASYMNSGWRFWRKVNLKLIFGKNEVKKVSRLDLLFLFLIRVRMYLILADQMKFCKLHL